MRVAIFQSDAGGLNTTERLRALDQAISGDAFDLVVCPELFISGYDVGEDLINLAQTPNEEFAREVIALAKSHSTAIVFGYPERAEEVVYNSALCISKEGELLANHRKLALPPGFEPKYFTPGTNSDPTLFELGGMCCALLICYDVEFPETVRAAATSGADLVIVPTALGKDWGIVSTKLIPTRAFENGVWMIYADHAGTENNSTYYGGSCIVSPTGEDLARAGSDQELIFARIDMQKVADARDRLPYLKEAKRLRKALKTESNP